MSLIKYLRESKKKTLTVDIRETCEEVLKHGVFRGISESVS